MVLNEKAINNIEWWQHCSLLLPSASIVESQTNITLFTDMPLILAGEVHCVQALKSQVLGQSKNLSIYHYL